MVVRRVCSSAFFGAVQCRRITSSPASILTSQLDASASHENSTRSACMTSSHNICRIVTIFHWHSEVDFAPDTWVHSVGYSSREKDVIRCPGRGFLPLGDDECRDAPS